MDLELAERKIVNQSLREVKLNMLLEEENDLKKKIAKVKMQIQSNHKGAISAKAYIKNREKWINHLNHLHPEIEYVSGYKVRAHDCSKSFQVLIRDKKTGIRFYVASSELRQPSWKPNLKRIHPHKVLKEDREKWYPLANRDCKGKLIAKPICKAITFLQCEYCGRTFEQHYGRHFCSKKCRNKYDNLSKQRRKDARTKQAKKNGNYDKSITLAKVYKRDHGVCYICGKHLILNDDYNRLDAPTIEHVVPICKGGTHTWDNVRLACRACNGKKGITLSKRYINKAFK